MDPRAQVVGLIKRITEHRYTQNIKDLGLIVSERNKCVCFTIIGISELHVIPVGWGHFEPHGHH